MKIKEVWQNLSERLKLNLEQAPVSSGNISRGWLA